MKTFKVVLVLGTVLAAQSASALERELINNALNETLVERASVEREYKENSSADRPEATQRKSGRIEVVIDSEIGGSSGGLKSHAKADVYREKRVQVKLDKEVQAIEKDLATSPEVKKTDELLN